MNTRRPAAAIARAVVAAAVMGVSLAMASFIAAMAGASASPDHPLGVRVATAAPVAILVTAAIVVLRRRWDGEPLAGIGLSGPRRDLPGLLTGIGVVAGAGAAVLGVLSLVGRAQWGTVQLGPLLAFLGTNAVVALLFEAIPEEVSIRGYALTALRSAFSGTAATVLTIATFLLVPLIAMATQALLDVLTGTGPDLWLAPAGEEPLLYYSMLAAFGLLLIYARDATAAATVWTCIGAHLAWLTVNRIVLGGADGVHIDLGGLGTLIFFAGYASVAIIAFSLLGQRAQRSSAVTRSRADPLARPST